MARPITFQHHFLSFRGSTQTRLRLEFYSGDWHEPWILGDGTWAKNAYVVLDVGNGWQEKSESVSQLINFLRASMASTHSDIGLRRKWEYWGELNISIHELRQLTGSFEVILEWTLTFGGITVVISYCISEIVKQKQQQLVIKDRHSVTVSVV